VTPARTLTASILTAAGVGALALLVGDRATAQQLPAVVVAQQLEVGPQADPEKGKESNEPVYVWDSAIALEKLALALRWSG